jgi:hypothetical protein
MADHSQLGRNTTDPIGLMWAKLDDLCVRVRVRTWWIIMKLQGLFVV